MKTDLDAILNALAARPDDHGLGRLEADVWTAVRTRKPTGPSFVAARLAAVTGALALGVVAGGVTAASERRSPEIAAFAVDAPLAPSSLLGSPS